MHTKIVIPILVLIKVNRRAVAVMNRLPFEIKVVTLAAALVQPRLVQQALPTSAQFSVFSLSISLILQHFACISEVSSRCGRKERD
jgi:hypothetical protein